MADKDVNKGWGNLPGRLQTWHCPICGNDSPVKAWSIVNDTINGVSMDGRKCPQCDFKAFQHGDTQNMHPKVTA